MEELLIKVIFVVFIKQVMMQWSREAPEGLNVVKTNFTSISVEWQPLPQSNILGTVSGYRIKYAISHSAVYASMDLKSDQTQAIISNLEGNTEYKIKVAGLYNERQEEGPYSDKIDAKTSKQSSNPCDCDPCQNGGTCFEQGNHSISLFYCKCVANFSGEVCSVSLRDFACQSPVVSLPNISPNASSDFSFYKSRQFIIQSEVELNCELSDKTLFFWRVYQLGEEDTPLLSRSSFSELQIIPRLLPVGDFLVQLNVSIMGTAVFGVSQGYFQVVSSPLVALIAGGSKVARGQYRTLIFDASLSYDPDEED